MQQRRYDERSEGFSCRKFRKERGVKVVMFFFPVLLWIFSFRGFITGKLRLVDDATPYYDHTQFFIDNILLGIFPRWDPSWAWRQGLPFDFFLQRLGMCNPFFIVILILKKMGLSFESSYLAFLAVYYLIGTLGFYMLAKHIFRDSRMAFAAYLLLMFSSLGTKVFNSYLLLVCVPMVWFFYFLLSFTRKQEKHSLLGLTLTLVVLMTTYIPFYFVTVFLSFIICFACLYPRDLVKIPSRYFGFFKRQKVLACFCLLVLLVSFIPGFMLYQEAGRGDLVFPVRHAESSAKNEMVVDIQNTRGGGIITPTIGEDFFSNLTEFRLGRFYIPIFVFLPILLGAFNVMNKRLILFFLLGVWLFFIGLSDATPVYSFFYKYVFFFKLFRNLNYFLWFTVLPVFILFAVEQFRVFLDRLPQTRREKYAVLTLVFMVHAGFALFLFTRENIILSSYLVVGLSLIFFVLYFCGWLKAGQRISFFFLLALVTIQPLEVYYYLDKNSLKNAGGEYQSSTRGIDTRSFFGPCEEAEKTIDFSGPVAIASSVTVESRWINLLRKNLDYRLIQMYTSCPATVYDRVARFDEQNADFKRVGQAFITGRNVAFVPVDYSGPKTLGEASRYNPHAQRLNQNSRNLQILDFNANAVKIKTNFDSPKFFVYKNAFLKGWEAFVNGKKVKLWRANIAFRGLWLPEGENTVYFYYGPRWRYMVDFFLIGVCYIIFGYLLWVWINHRREHRKGILESLGGEKQGD